MTDATGPESEATPTPPCQHTLKSAISCTGIGLHSGARISITLAPGPVDGGVVFRRVDIPGGGRRVQARWDNVDDTFMCTRVADDSVSVATVEHLMAALAGCGIDNAVIEVNGPEVPVMDGSAAPFVFLIECAGIVPQDAPRRAIEVIKPVHVSDGDRHATLAPGSGLVVDFAFDIGRDGLPGQSLNGFGLTRSAFKREISRARTFGFLEDAKQLRAAGLALGASLDNAVVIDDGRVLNDGGLRHPDEFVRHKVLDAVGDLYMAGAPVNGHLSAVGSGHGLNNRLLHALFADPEAWQWTDAGAPPQSADTAPAPLAATA